MKRIIALLLALTMIFALCGCASKETTDTKNKNEYDIVVVDCAIAWETPDFVFIKPRVHNCTDMDAAYLAVNCALIGEGGRTIRVSKCDTGGVAAGANEWVSGTIQISKDELSKLVELQFSGGGFDIRKDDGKLYRQTVTFAEVSFSKGYVFGD